MYLKGCQLTLRCPSAAIGSTICASFRLRGYPRFLIGPGRRTTGKMFLLLHMITASLHSPPAVTEQLEYEDIFCCNRVPPYRATVPTGQPSHE